MRQGLSEVTDPSGWLRRSRNLNGAGSRVGGVALDGRPDRLLSLFPKNRILDDTYKKM